MMFLKKYRYHSVSCAGGYVNMVRRIYVEKKPDFAVSAKQLRHELRHYLNIGSVSTVRVLIRYDVENISEETYQKSLDGIFAEPPVDLVYEEKCPASAGEYVFSVEPLPGQFDQRADSAVQCVRFLNEEEEPRIRSAVTYLIGGALTGEDKEKIRLYCMNPVDSRITDETIPGTLLDSYPEPADIRIFDGFTQMGDNQLRELYQSLGLAMTWEDFLYIRDYFRDSEKRNPSVTEIRVLDTYWSDHCRHTTFSTELKNIVIEDGDYRKPIEDTLQSYLGERDRIWGGRKDKYVCLMDLALIGMRMLKKEGKLKDQEESDEINACSIVVPVDTDGRTEEWLLNFKNETHNHPTEIEPFGGAATCLGGAIRDPLSGRTYVYQAMRITGAADPTADAGNTLKGKLPQKKLVREAARGYSSYGNQIGLATGCVKEIYHPGYVAKRMEIGAVLGAAPRWAIVRGEAKPGDQIILLGGRTGRDGCGGATGSSKIHTEESTKLCGAEVQKGNPPTERKLQRLFRHPEVSRMIVKCNDFGAGGVSVAIGELADGLQINLDKVPRKYEGLDGTELAISESQERMAVVVSPASTRQFLEYAAKENLEATVVAAVTEEPRLIMTWRGRKIVSLERAFLNTNGAHQEADVTVEIPSVKDCALAGSHVTDVEASWRSMLSDLNVCSQRGLTEMFDSTIGAGSVVMPYGGKYQRTQTQTMSAHFPVLQGHTSTVSMMSYGFDPYISSWSPYHGAVYAVTESIAKIAASGGDCRKIRFTFQEYFRRMSQDPKRWSQPFASLLGAFAAQKGYQLPAIGGKDSMSGTFNTIDVPPTLVSFAVDVAKETDIITPEFKNAGSKIVLVKIPVDEYELPRYGEVMELYDCVHRDMTAGRIISAYALERHGIAAALSHMAFGNGLGFTIDPDFPDDSLFAPGFGDLLLEVPPEKVKELTVSSSVIGTVTEVPVFKADSMEMSLETALSLWEKPLSSVFPPKAPSETEDDVTLALRKYKNIAVCGHKIAVPRVFIPVFPGTNCEYDSVRAFERAGAWAVTKVFCNRNSADIRDSINDYADEIRKCQIIMFPGGFSAGDEPDGSAKFFAAAFRNARIAEAIEELLRDRDGLILGICNGFQALIKLGLLPEGRITGQTEQSPTLTYNTVGRHISRMVNIRVASNLSPWLAEAEPGNVYTTPISHGEGRFAASDECLAQLAENGQIATQYVNDCGKAVMDSEWNPNGSYMAVEGITSPDGRIFGKMAHAERIGDHVAINISGEQDMKIFESGVSYFR